MEWESVLKSLDELAFEHTGKHLSSLQTGILKGVLNGQKYADIAQKHQCTAGHVKDEGYELWQVLSAVLGENLNKSNFCATIERLGVANSNSSLINPVQIGHLNLCPNSETIDPDLKTTTESPLTSEQKRAITKLLKFGLKPIQIAEVLDLQAEQIQHIEID